MEVVGDGRRENTSATTTATTIATKLISAASIANAIVRVTSPT